MNETERKLLLELAENASLALRATGDKGDRIKATLISTYVAEIRHRQKSLARGAANGR